ncbi:MAG: adenylate/guanylate cyclase domain-containing protein [Nocardioides sp.]|uniref:adenylate/guanylate cyclase domain-containing protein n=1 Tax=Nocardioides sp. TaxID=35761 RepID=UPI0039E719F2
MTEVEPRSDVLRDNAEYDAHQVADLAGVDVEQSRRLWRALGFPTYRSEVAFTRADVEALRRVSDLIEAGVLDLETALNLGRALGQTMARLADWEVGTLTDHVDLAEEDQTPTSRAAAALAVVEEVNPAFEDLLIYVWRRHLAAATERVRATLGGTEEDVDTVEVTVGFADLVAFTALSNRLDKDRIGDLVEVFESRCADVVAAQGGRVVKSIGDSVLFLHDDPREALAIASGIIQLVGRDKRLPDVRVGLATGPVVTRLGDVFGPPVNLAARLTAVARRNRVIVDEATAEQLPREEYQIRRLPARPVRGFGVIEPLTARPLT